MKTKPSQLRYWKKYYSQYKKKLCASKRRRYRRDAKYRQDRIYSSKVRHLLRKVTSIPLSSDGEKLWTLRELAGKLKRDYFELSRKAKLYFPPPLKIGRYLYFTNSQVELLSMLYSMQDISYPILQKVLPKFWNKKSSEYTAKEVVENVLKLKKPMQGAILRRNNHEHGKLRKCKITIRTGENMPKESGS